jgi:hypothetical protein
MVADTSDDAGLPARVNDRLFLVVLVALTALAVAPFWLTRILPMQDYPQILLFARAWGDCKDPASPFHGTYTTGFPLSPLILPILALRGLGAVFGLETAGRILWTAYAVALPAASLHLLATLRRDRWAVLLVYPILLSYWVLGGFFSFATSAPLLVIALSLGVRWLTAPTRTHGAAFAAIVCVLELWHAIAFIQIVIDFTVLWLILRRGELRRVRAFVPLAPGLLLFAAWMGTTFVGRPPGSRPPRWPPFAESARHFFELIGPTFSHAIVGVVALTTVVLVASFVSQGSVERDPYRVANPFAIVASVAVVAYFILPADCFGVQGISNRQPWLAALLLVFAWRVPSRRAPRAAVLGLVGGAGALVLVFVLTRFVAFDRESAGASRLIDRLGPGDTLLSPLRGGFSTAIPGKPLSALELYASIRHGGLPNSSFAGYDYNIVRYVDGKNPMPGLIVDWLKSPALGRFDYVLLRNPPAGIKAQADVMQEVQRDGEWVLYGVCGSKSRPCE